MSGDSFYKKLIPSSARVFAETLLGSKAPITKEDFTKDELKQLNATIENARAKRTRQLPTGQVESGTALVDPALQLKTLAKGNGTVQYGDYSTTGTSNVRNDASVSSKDAIRNTLGRFAYEKTKDGKRKIIDRYDFTDDLADSGQRSTKEYEDMNPVEKAYTVAKETVANKHGLKAGLNTLPSRVGSAYIGRNGREVQLEYSPEEVDAEQPFKRGGAVKPKTRSTGYKGYGIAKKV
jgi:hypothetical protein